jgi:hypothetical protein
LQIFDEGEDTDKCRTEDSGIIKEEGIYADREEELLDDKVVPYPTEWEEAKKGMFFTALHEVDDHDKEENNE